MLYANLMHSGCFAASFCGTPSVTVPFICGPASFVRPSWSFCRVSTVSEENDLSLFASCRGNSVLNVNDGKFGVGVEEKAKNLCEHSS